MDVVIPTRFDRDTLAPLVAECQKVARGDPGAHRAGAALREGLRTKAVLLKNTRHERPPARFGDPLLGAATEQDRILYRSRWGD